MKALWLERGALRLVDAPTPRIDTGEALIKVLKAGICGTDAALVAGMYAFTGIPGHEFVGKVETGPEALTGRRVVGEINVVCGRCKMCASGRSKHCSRRTALGILPG